MEINSDKISHWEKKSFAKKTVSFKIENKIASEFVLSALINTLMYKYPSDIPLEEKHGDITSNWER